MFWGMPTHAYPYGRHPLFAPVPGERCAEAASLRRRTWTARNELQLARRSDLLPPVSSPHALTSGRPTQVVQLLEPACDLIPTGGHQGRQLQRVDSTRLPDAP